MTVKQTLIRAIETVWRIYNIDPTVNIWLNKSELQVKISVRFQGRVSDRSKTMWAKIAPSIRGTTTHTIVENEHAKIEMLYINWIINE